MLTRLLLSPRQTTLRKVLCTIHLWLGLLIALWVVVIGTSGSLLVFQEEFRRLSLPHAPFRADQNRPIDALIEQARHALPGEELTFLVPPQQPSPWWTLYYSHAGKTRTVYADAQSGELLPLRHRLWIDWVEDVHVYLLGGHTGFVLNCSMGIAMLLVTLSGIVLWWRGLATWAQGLVVRLRSGWRRINFDLHSAVGFWTLPIVLWWSLTAVWFLFPTQVTWLVNSVLPLQAMNQPTAAPASTGSAVVPLSTLLNSPAVASHGFVGGIALPATPGETVTIYVDRDRPGDFSHRDIDTFDGHTGRLLSCWHYGENRTLGDWLLWLVYPLHFGTLWGLPIKILWSFLGLCLVSLSISGFLMYWNRRLSKLWRQIRQS